MGAVYEAVHESMGGRAAVKVLIPRLADDPLPANVFASLHGHGVVVVRDGAVMTARLTDARPAAGAPLTCTPGGTYVIRGTDRFRALPEFYCLVVRAGDETDL